MEVTWHLALGLLLGQVLNNTVHKLVLILSKYVHLAGLNGIKEKLWVI